MVADSRGARAQEKVIPMSYSLILGGARSGKSHYAEAQATKISNQTGWPVIYLATATITDPEMAHRISQHQAERPQTWTTIEEPSEVATWLNETYEPTVVLLDCLSLLLNNWMFANPDDSQVWAQRQEQFYQALLRFPYPTIVVSNEVGQGIVPDNALARQYRDALGRFNQKLAATADPVILMVAGLPIDVRKVSPSW